ncbi:MAG TPA: sucrase ferredoxin [Mycobacteriales bacterium]|nr:sucrase ferredoxin [Mycobacteriales bacterium]
MTAVASREEATTVAPGCATVARSLGEAPEGTATPMRSWILIEHPEAWARDVADKVLVSALPSSRLRELAELRRRHGLRPLLIRRPGYRAGLPATRTVLVGSAHPGRRWLERVEITDLRELADLELAAVASGRGGVGTPVTGAVFGVCTHGSKDMCCATLGRPVAKALAAAAPGRVWETTHLGGDRFAGNVLVLPGGFLYGHVTSASAPRLAAAADDDRVLPELLRGRTSVGMRAQVAEIAVRRVTGLHGLDDVEPIGEDGSGLVIVRAGGTRMGVRLGRHPLGVCGTSRCAGPTTPCGYSVDELVELP